VPKSQLSNGQAELTSILQASGSGSGYVKFQDCIPVSLATRLRVSLAVTDIQLFF
jgi:hypothetical protein